MWLILKPAGNMGKTLERKVKECKLLKWPSLFHTCSPPCSLLLALAQTGHSNAFFVCTHECTGASNGGGGGGVKVRKEKVKILHRMAREM